MRGFWVGGLVMGSIQVILDDWSNVVLAKPQYNIRHTAGIRNDKRIVSAHQDLPLARLSFIQN